MEITPRTIIGGFIAIFVTLQVGPALSQAKRNAVFPLLGECTSVFGVIGGGASSETFGGFIMCSLGTVLIIALPGMGIGWMFFKSFR